MPDWLAISVRQSDICSTEKRRRYYTMTIYYKAADRKPLVKAVSEFTGTDAVYLRTPTYAYQIGDFTITRDGNLEFDDSADSGEIEKLTRFLAEKGFAAEAQKAAEIEPGEDAGTDTAEPETEPQGESVGLTVAMPREYFKEDALGNLEKLLEAKGGLIKKALGIEALPIHTDEEKVSFPWFEIKSEDSDTAGACTHLIYSLCEMARNQKRITAKEKEVENEKYAFRCFLLRLGFIGADYKAERKVLLKNFSGSSAFKNGGAGHEISE